MAYHHGNLRAALIAAAIDIIDEEGLDGVSIRKVADRVGVSVAAPFRHFSSKADLISAVAETAIEKLVNTITHTQSEGPEDDALHQLELFSIGYIRWVRDNPTQYDLIGSRPIDEFKVSEKLFELYMWLRDTMFDLIVQAERDGQLRPGCPHGRAVAARLSLRAAANAVARALYGLAGWRGSIPADAQGDRGLF
ncbi:DNA-binding transcriptional regulator, AcrR family [Paracoccus isoporae]|uniref:DNA-binding transcriptional regulator, AcrR family n=1 Tax=Paracoccus isoporae TaxID=591205 RepID=A0A1G6V3Y8_9RHOB|nr:TetR/AcrR family transcriptional regulator [Paracoccus isoporae]SDD48360.1 DNA-binding transcriptional regulator, AcrR family [Paracoccus isoporae]